MRKRLYWLLAVISMILCFACIFNGCNGSESTDNPSGIETPVETPDGEPEKTPIEPEQPEDEGGESGDGVFQGNPPSRPNKEDKYDAN